MIPVRFSDHERYDINDDCQKRVMIATTPTGSYWTEFESKSAANYREMKTKFKNTVVECIQREIEPREIDLA